MAVTQFSARSHPELASTFQHIIASVGGCGPRTSPSEFTVLPLVHQPGRCGPTPSVSVHALQSFASDSDFFSVNAAVSYQRWAIIMGNHCVENPSRPVLHISEDRNAAAMLYKYPEDDGDPLLSLLPCASSGTHARPSHQPGPLA
jgi:hypothetical protein